MPSEVKIEVDKIVGYVYPIKDQLKAAGARWRQRWCYACILRPSRPSPAP